MAQLSADNQVNDRSAVEGPQAQRWRLLVVLLASILVSQAPTFYGQFAFVEEHVSKNDFMLAIVLPYLSQILMIAVLIGVWRVNCSVPQIAISWIGKKKTSTILGVITLPIILLTLNEIILHVFNRLDIYVTDRPQSDQTHGIAFVVPVILLGVLMAPVVEEMFWRGYVQGVLQRVFNPLVGLFVQAILFALVHMVGITGRFPVFVIGFILGVWRWRKRTLLPLIVAHMVFNSWCFVRPLRDHLEVRKVRIARDYRVSLENICRPTDYVPENNALPHYARAFELLVERPEELGGADIMTWPTGLSDETMVLLRSWISANQAAMAEFEAGSQKAYYFREYSKEPFGDLWARSVDESAQMLVIVLLRAQISAAQGDLHSSVSDILTCYRFGQHFAAPKPLFEQLTGLAVKEGALLTAFGILEDSGPDDTYLTELQSGLEALSEREEVPIDFTADRLMFHEFIQRTFTDDGKGNGRIPRAFFDSRGNPGPYLRRLGCFETGEEQMKRWWNLERRHT
ncbi:MAG: type II CAAX endopeptidase family protein, partial [Phycisphaerales bacterium]